MADAEEIRPSPGWAWDPSKRHEYRYWDGEVWTERVSDDGEIGSDPVLPRGYPAATTAEPGGSTADPNTLEGFFADRSRQGSSSVGLGEEWRSLEAPGVEFHLHWLEATGEVFLLRAAPIEVDLATPNSGVGLLDMGVALWQSLHHHKAMREIQTEVLAQGLTLAEVTRRLGDWQIAMLDPDGVAWLRTRFVRTAG